MRNRHRWGLLGLLLLAAPAAHAAPAGDALLIGVDGPDPGGGGCAQTATADVDGEHRPRLTDGLRLALDEDARNQPHLLGTALSASGFPLGQGWTAVAAALRPVGHGLTLAPDAPPPALSGMPPPDSSLVAAPAAESPSPEAPPAATPLAPSATSPGGRESWARTGAGNGEHRNWHPRPAAVPGANLPASSRTARIHTALARRGTYLGPIDGKYAPAVAEAVRSFQRQLGDLPTGVLTRSEIVQLLNS